MLYEAVLSKKARGKFARAAAAQRLAGDQCAGDEQFRCMLFVLLVCFSSCFFFLVVLFFFFSLVKLSLSEPPNCLTVTLLILSPVLLWGEQVAA